MEPQCSIGLYCYSRSIKDILFSELTNMLLVFLSNFLFLSQMIRMTDFTPSRRDLLEEMSLQAEVLDRVSYLLLEKNDNISACDGWLKIHD